MKTNLVLSSRVRIVHRWLRGLVVVFFFFRAEDGIRDLVRSRGLGDVYKRQIMGNMDIAERRLPQDGRTSFETAQGDAVDLRLASIPTLHGENISIRILEVSPLPPTLDSLGLTGASLERFEEAVRRPEGGILICGPTGCGKSTTLYTTLELVKSPESKIYTCLLYTSDAADDLLCVDLGGRRVI